MQRISFDPLAGPPQLPPSLAGLIGSGHASSTRYYLIQFAGSFQDSFAAPVEAAGAELLEYLPEATFLSRIPPEQVDAVRDLPIVRWVGPYQPAYRVSENLDPFLQSDEDVVIQVRVLAGGSPEAVAHESANLGTDLLFLSQPRPDLSGYMRLNVRGNLVPAIAQIEGVAWVERYVEGGTPEVTAGSRR